MNRGEPGTSVKVIGVGGAGINAVNHVIDVGLSRLEFIAIDFDWSALEKSKAPIKFRLESTWRGLDGPGKEHRQKDTLVQKPKIRQAIGVADAVIVVAGLGGGTGSGTTPAIINIAKEQGALTIAIVNTPFHFEGTHRKVQGLEALKTIDERADIMVMIPADVVLRKADKKFGVKSVFDFLNAIMAQAVHDVLGLLT